MAHHFFIQGPLGSGKTLLMSVLAHHWKAKVQRMGGDITLFSNYELDESIPVNHYTDWYEVAKAQGSICCWDEAHMAFSNRRWSKFGQSIATDVMMYTRKMKSVQIYCSPSINNVDSRIRQIVEVLITAKQTPKGFYYHFVDYQTGEFMHKQYLPMWKANRIKKIQLYDTDTMVRGFPVPSTEKQAEEFFEKLEQIHNEERRKRKVLTAS